jgi:hypothetical protein
MTIEQDYDLLRQHCDQRYKERRDGAPTVEQDNLARMDADDDAARERGLCRIGELRQKGEA